MSEFFRVTPPGILGDDDAGFLTEHWTAVPEAERPFYAAKLNEYQNFRTHYPRPLTPSEQQERATERARVTELFNDFDAATQGDRLGTLQFADADETPRIKTGLANRAFVQHLTGLEGDKLERDYELARDALAKQMFGGAGVADDARFHGEVKNWLTNENGKDEVRRSLIEAGRRAAAWEGSGLSDAVRPSLKTWQEGMAGKPGYEMDFSGEYERTFRAAQAEARADFDRLRPFVDSAWQILSGGKEGDTPGAVDFEGLADQLMQVPQEDRRKVLSMVKARAELLPEKEQAGFWSRASKTFGRQFEAIGQGFVNEAPRIVGGIGGLGQEDRERQAIYEDVRNLQRLDLDPVTARNGWERAGLAVAGSLPGLAAMFTISPWAMVGQLASDARQSARSAMEAKGVPAEYSGEVANGIALPAALAMSYLEKVTLGMANSLPGVKQLQAKLLTTLSESATKRALAMGGAFALETVEQNVQEALQDATPTVLTDLAETLGAPLPEIQAWAPAIETLTDPAAWATAAVFAGFGFGRMPDLEAAQILRERGASKEQIQTVLAAPDAEAHRAAVMDAIQNPGGKPLAPDLATANAETAADEAEAGVASVTRDKDGWWVTHEDGRRTKTESAAAARMLVEDLGQVTAQDEADAMVSIADWMVEKDEKAAQTFTGSKLTTDGRDVFEEHKDRAPRLMPMDKASAAALDEEFSRLAAAEGGAAPMTRLIEGSNAIEWRARLADDAVAVVESMTLQQNKGGTVLTQFHELAEARWRTGIETGAINMAETFTALRMLERATGLQYLSEDPSETDVREAVSEAVSAYVFSRKKDGSRSPAGAVHKGMRAALEASTTAEERAAVGKFRSMLRALRAYFRQLFKAAAAITKARREGKIKDGDAFSSFADKLLGVDGQRAHETAVAKAVGVDAGGQTFSLGRGVTPKNPVVESIDGISAKDIFKSAKNKFGVTRSIYEAGYVLPDGTMLDFTGRFQTGGFKQGEDLVFRSTDGRDWMKDQRGVDHREIEWDGMPEYGEQWGAMVDFLRLGAIRVDGRSGMISMHSRAKPTSAQNSVLKAIVISADGAYLDLEDDAGNRSAMSLQSGKFGKVQGLLTRWAAGETPEYAGETFALSSASGLERLANQIANRPSTPAAKARIFNRMAADLAGMARSVALNDGNATISRIGEIRQQARELRAKLLDQYENEALADGAGEILGAAEMASITGNRFLNWLTNGTTGLQMKGRLMSRTRAAKIGAFDADQGHGDYDDAPVMPPAFVRGNQTPDQVAREAHDAGLLEADDVSLLWEKIGTELASVEKWRQRVRAAESRMMQARRRASVEAREWEAKATAEARANAAAASDRDGKRALVILDKMLASLPAEVRARVGGFTRVAELKSNDARFKYFASKVVEIDRVLETHLRNDYLEQLREVFRTTAPRMAAGERDKGKIGTNAHAWMQEAERIMGLSEHALEAEEDQVDKLASAAVITPATVTHYGRLFDFATDEDGARVAIEQHQALLNLFGGLTHRNGENGPPRRSAGEIFAALEAAQEMETSGRLGYFAEVIARRERRAQRRATAIAEAGGDGTLARKQLQRENESGIARWAREYADTHFSFEGFVSSVFGQDGQTHQWADQTTLRSDLAYRDAMRAREQTLGDFLRSLWPRTSTRQRQRRIEKLATSRDVPDAPQGTPRMSELDAVHLTMLWMDTDTGSREWLESHGLGQDTQTAMEAMLSDEAKAIRRWLVEGYDAQYDQINAVHRRMYGVNMPRVKNYAPRLVDHGGNSSDMQLDPLQEGRQLMAGFTKRRRLNTKSPPRQVDALTAYWQNAHAVEYWTAWAETMGDMKATFSHFSTQAAVKASNGEGTGTALNEWLGILDRGGVQNANGQGAIRRWTAAMADSALVAKLGVLGKQLVASYASASQIGISEYLGAVQRIASGQASITLREVYRMPVIQRRMATDSPEVRTATKGRGLTPMESRIDAFLGMVGTDIHALDNAHLWLRERIGWMDAVNTTLSAAAAYDVAFREAQATGMSEADARAAAVASMETVVADSAQPDSVRNKSLSEHRTGLWGRLLMPFQSANRQALGMFLLSIKQGRTADAVRQGVLHWMVTGIVAQTIGSVFRSIFSGEDLDDVWEWEDYARSVIIGPLTGARYLGMAIEAAAPLIGGFERRQAPVPMAEGIRLMRNAATGEWDYKALTDSLNAVGLLIGGRASWASIASSVLKQGGGLADTVTRTDAERDAEQSKRDKATIKAAAEKAPKPEKPQAQKDAEKAARRAREKAEAQAIRDRGGAE